MTKLLIISLLIILSFITKAPVFAANLNSEQIAWCEDQKLDRRVLTLQSYLAQYNSPLQNSAQDFVDAADQYNLDWKLVAAISGVESTFGKFIPGGFNGWGWGVYGTQAIYFKSWKDGIYTVSKGLRKNYFDKGYTNPYSINRIYAASPTWGTKVSYFLKDMERFENKQNMWVEDLQLEFQTAGGSALLSLK